MSKLPGERGVGSAHQENRVGSAHQDQAGGHRPPYDPAAAEIHAEISDHLATAAEQLQGHGLSAAEAQAKSQEQFGDARAIGRRCYWIKRGDYLMFRTAVMVLLAMLCLALGFTTFSSWRTQRQMAEQMTALAEQLTALAERQRTAAATPLPPAGPKPLEITGQAFFGSPDKQAANINITIIDVKDGSHVRRIATDAGGKFNSGALGGGDYALVAQIEPAGPKDPPGPWTSRWVQSAPIVVYPGVSVPTQQFDVGRHLAAITIETSRPLPKTTVDNRYTIDTRLMVKVQSSQNRTEPWLAAMPPPLAWPVYPQFDYILDRDRAGARSGPNSSGGSEFFDLFSAADLPTLAETTNSGKRTFGWLATQLPAGKIEVAAAVLADVYPVGYEPPEIPKRRTSAENRDEYEAAMKWQNLHISPAPVGLRWGGKVGANGYSADDDRFVWMTKGLGRIWLTHLRGPAEEAKPRVPQMISSRWLQAKSVIEVASDKPVRLRVMIPDDLEPRIRELVDSTTDPAEFAKSILARKDSGTTFFSDERADMLDGGNPLASPFFRSTTIAVLGTEPLQPDDAVP